MSSLRVNATYSNCVVQRGRLPTSPGKLKAYQKNKKKKFQLSWLTRSRKPVLGMAPALDHVQVAGTSGARGPKPKPCREVG